MWDILQYLLYVWLGGIPLTAWAASGYVTTDLSWSGLGILTLLVGFWPVTLGVIAFFVVKDNWWRRL